MAISEMDIKDAQCAENKDGGKISHHIISRLGTTVVQKGRYIDIPNICCWQIDLLISGVEAPDIGSQLHLEAFASVTGLFASGKFAQIGPPKVRLG